MYDTILITKVEFYNINTMNIMYYTTSKYKFIIPTQLNLEEQKNLLLWPYH